MFHVVQRKARGEVGAEDRIQQCKKEAEEWEDKVKKNKKLEKEREQYKGELCVVQW